MRRADDARDPRHRSRRLRGGARGVRRVRGRGTPRLRGPAVRLRPRPQGRRPVGGHGRGRPLRRVLLHEGRRLPGSGSPRPGRHARAGPQSDVLLAGVRGRREGRPDPARSARAPGGRGRHGHRLQPGGAGRRPAARRTPRRPAAVLAPRHGVRLSRAGQRRPDRRGRTPRHGPHTPGDLPGARPDPVRPGLPPRPARSPGAPLPQHPANDPDPGPADPPRRHTHGPAHTHLDRLQSQRDGADRPRHTPQHAADPRQGPGVGGRSGVRAGSCRDVRGGDQRAGRAGAAAEAGHGGGVRPVPLGRLRPGGTCPQVVRPRLPDDG